MAVQQDVVVQLLLKHRGKLLGAIRAMVSDEHLAEDIFQEVSIAAINKCNEIADVEHFAAWVRYAARFQALVALRNRNRLPRALSADVLDSLEAHWQQFDRQPDSDISEALRYCLDRLSPYARKLIDVRYVQHKRGNDLAATLHRSLNTVYVALSRVDNTLRDCLNKKLARETSRA
jgi:RNA polymerase sigma-70 factor (ECF subfamily)